MIPEIHQLKPELQRLVGGVVRAVGRVELADKVNKGGLQVVLGDGACADGGVERDEAVFHSAIVAGSRRRGQAEIAERVLGNADMTREPHIWTPAHDACRSCIACGRPFETYVDQPSTADRVRRDVLSIEFALLPKKEDAA